jgi:hypothetical protein
VQNAIPVVGCETWLWGINALFAFGYEKIKLQRYIEYEIPN